MAINNKIKNYYATWFNQIVPAGVTLTPGLRILNAVRGFYLKSVLINIDIENNVVGVLVPQATNTVLEFNMNIVQAGGQALFKTCESTALPAPTPDNTLWLFGPGKYNFAGIYFVNDILIAMEARNLDPGNDYLIRLSLLFEIEET